MDIILAFPLNHPSVLLIYRYSVLHVSAKFDVKVQWHESLYVIALLPISPTSVGNTFFCFLVFHFVGI